MFQAEVLWSGHLSTSGHLTNHREKHVTPGQLSSMAPDAASSSPSPAAPNSDTYFKQLHDGGVLRVVGVQARLRGPFTDFFHIVQSGCTNVGHSIQAAKPT